MRKFLIKYNTEIPLIIFGIFWIILFPFFKFNIDTDSSSYLYLADQFALGNFWESVTGYWSPLNIYLLKPFIDKGLSAWHSALLVNFLSCGLLLIQIKRVLKKVLINTVAITIFMYFLPIILVNFSYHQLFGDVLQLNFTIIYISFLLDKSFLKSIKKISISALIMGLSFYAKAYMLPFFLLHLGVIYLWSWYKKRIQFYKAISLYFLALFICILIVLPWTITLYKKYNSWSLFGHSGKMNLSWHMESKRNLKPEIKLLIPPSSLNAPSSWVDPFQSQGVLYHPFSSLKHFARWSMRFVHTSLMALVSFQELSFLSIAVLLISIWFYFSKTNDDEKMQKIILTILILPVGYLFMHIESRYIWLNTFLVFILGVKLLNLLNISKRGLIISLFIFSISFCVFPILNLFELRFKNKELFDMAKEMKLHNIDGSITSNCFEQDKMWIVSYLNKNQYFTIDNNEIKIEELKYEMKRYKVNYFIDFSQKSIFVKNHFLDPNFEFVFQSTSGASFFKFKN